jgi:hypothetical protein
MKKAFLNVFMAGTLVLLISLTLLYGFIYFFPNIMDEYYSPVFRSSSFATDILFYVHPYVLSISLFWFWDRFKISIEGSLWRRAIHISLTYCIVAMLPVLWLTFSAIDISLLMVLTWIAYGTLQAFVAGLVFSKLNPS